MCINYTASILRCCNKIYLHEIFSSKKIKTPKSYFIQRKQKDFSQFATMHFPMVVKIPDESFSLGVFKVNSVQELEAKAKELFKDSELLLVQEFLPSDYDWRIVILGGVPLFACKCYMVRKHWQIYKHDGSKRLKSGDLECIPLEKVPD